MEITLDKTEVSLYKGETTELTANVTPENAKVTWSSSDEKVAIVDENGKVIAIGVGTATITAETEDGSKATCIVTVQEKSEEPSIPEEIKEVTYIPKEESEEKANKELSNVIDKIKNGEDLEDAITEDTLVKIKEAINAGKELITEIFVENVVNNNIDKELREIVKETIQTLMDGINSNNVEIAQYMDISILIKTADGELCGTLDELTEEITITLAIPEHLRKEGRTFYVIRVHKGESKLIPTTENTDGTVSFKSEKFSDYVLIYQDAKLDNEEPITPPDTQIPTSPETGHVEETKTEVNLFEIVTYALLFVLAGMFLLQKKGKKNK